MLLALIFFLRCAAPILAATPPSIADLELQVAALTTIDEMQLTADQIEAIKKLGADPTPTPAPATGLADPAYRKDLADLRDALRVSGAGDQKKLMDAQNRVDDIRRKSKIVPSAKVTITEEAKKNAAKALAVLSSGQIADYIALHSSEILDPADIILDALDQCREEPNDTAFNELCQQTAEEVDFLMEGYNGRNSAANEAKVTKGPFKNNLFNYFAVGQSCNSSLHETRAASNAPGPSPHRSP